MWSYEQHVGKLVQEENFRDTIVREKCAKYRESTVLMHRHYSL